MGYSIGNEMVTLTHESSDAVFRAIADPTRREILTLLRAGQHTVGEIAGNFQVSRPAISKHIRLLHSTGLITTQQVGTTTVCSLNAEPLQVVNAWLQDYESLWGEGLQNLKTFVEENG